MVITEEERRTLVQEVMEENCTLSSREINEKINMLLDVLQTETEPVARDFAAVEATTMARILLRRDGIVQRTNS